MGVRCHGVRVQEACAELVASAVGVGPTDALATALLPRRQPLTPPKPSTVPHPLRNWLHTLHRVVVDQSDVALRVQADVLALEVAVDRRGLGMHPFQDQDHFINIEPCCIFCHSPVGDKRPVLTHPSPDAYKIGFLNSLGLTLLAWTILPIVPSLATPATALLPSTLPSALPTVPSPLLTPISHTTGVWVLWPKALELLVVEEDFEGAALK